MFGFTKENWFEVHQEETSLEPARNTERRAISEKKEMEIGARHHFCTGYGRTSNAVTVWLRSQTHIMALDDAGVYLIYSFYSLFLSDPQCVVLSRRLFIVVVS